MSPTSPYKKDYGIVNNWRLKLVVFLSDRKWIIIKRREIK